MAKEEISTGEAGKETFGHLLNKNCKKLEHFLRQMVTLKVVLYEILVEMIVLKCVAYFF